MSDIEAMKNYVYQACADRPHQVDPRIFMVGGPDSYALGIQSPVTHAEAQVLADKLNVQFHRGSEMVVLI